MEYQPVQKKNSSWTPTPVQKKGKSPGKMGHSSIQPKSNPSSAPSPEIREYSRASADRLAANVMRGIQAKELELAESSTLQRKSESPWALTFEPPPPLPQSPASQLKGAFAPVSQNPIQRQCADCAKEEQEQSGEAGKDLKEIGIQTKLTLRLRSGLTVGAPGDAYEQEADRVASQVMLMSAPPDSSASVQRQLDTNHPHHPKQIWKRAQSITPVVHRQIDPRVQMRQMIQRAHQIDGNQASGDLESRLNASKGGGSPLSEGVRGFMEPRFGADFSGVRVHTGGEAVQMNQELGAQAFTHGSDVYFGQGKEPGNNELTAHELTHVVQQSGKVQPKDSMPVFEGHTPESPLLDHLQSRRNSSNTESPNFYRKEIAQFQQSNLTKESAKYQELIINPPNPVNVHETDTSPTIRRFSFLTGCDSNNDSSQGSGASQNSGATFTRDDILSVNPRNTEGWIRGRIGAGTNGEIVSLPDYLKVKYQERRNGRDYFKIMEGPNLGKTGSLPINSPSYLDSSRSWDGAVSLEFREDASRSTQYQSRGTLDYGAGTVDAKIFVNPDTEKISPNRDYPLQVPDAPHAGGSRYGDYAKTWFRIEGGPQGDEYLHRGDRSAGCVSVAENWSSVYGHLINKRSSNRHIGTIKRVIT